MTTNIKAYICRAPLIPNDPTPWVARARAIDFDAPHPVETIRVTRSARAASFPEALQLAQVQRERLHDVLMDEVHESRSSRRAPRCECPIGMHSINCPTRKETAA